jgi:uncharacterized membrane protein HdeD (DUF308 family)
MPGHEEKYISKLLLGFGLIIAGVMSILYACFERSKHDDWYVWGVVSSLLLGGGVYFMLSGFVHKVKADLIRRQKIRNQQKTADVEGR